MDKLYETYETIQSSVWFSVQHFKDYPTYDCDSRCVYDDTGRSVYSHLAIRSSVINTVEELW